MKSSIKRTDLKKNMMRTIIFRIDYQGIIGSMDDLVNVFHSTFQNKFKKFDAVFQNTIDIELNNAEDISKSLSIPVKEIIKQQIYRFSENEFGTDSCVLDISKYYTALVVTCTNYSYIDEYLKFFSEYIEFLFKENSFIQIKRLGLRKIGGKIYNQVDNIYDDFEKEYFNFKIGEYHVSRNNYTDVLFADKSSPVINFNRSLESGFEKVQHPDGRIEENPAYQVILDLDGFYDESRLSTIKFSKDNTKEILETINHKHLFDIFIMSMTEDFIEKNKKND